MARIVFAAHGLRSALNNTAAVARQLVERGHDVTFISFRDVRADVEHVGARFVLLADGRNAIDRQATLRARRVGLRSLRELRRIRSELLELEEPVRVLTELSPDLVVVDIELHGCVIAAEHLGIPAVLTTSWHDPTRSWRRPPMDREFVHSSGAVAGARVRLAWVRLLAARRVRHALGPFLPRAARARVLPQQLNTPDYGSIRKMAQNLDVDLAAISSRTHWINPLTYLHRPILSYTVKELEFDHESPTGVIHVGPNIDLDRYRKPLDAGSFDDMERLLRRFSAPGHHLAYCSMGSLQSASLAYYQTVVDAFADDPSWGLILGMGSQGAGIVLRTDRTNVLAMSDAPQLRILEACDVAIHTGGAGTFYECVRFAVPSIVMHTGRTDMPGISARVDHFGLGVVRNRELITADVLGADARELASGSLASTLAEFQQIVLDYEGRSMAADLIQGAATK